MSLTPTEGRIVDARQVGVAICDMDELQQKISMTGIIFKIGVICGIPLPTNPAHINALDDELIKFIKDYGYSNLTAEEILTAFRMNANFELEDKIENYGAVFNIDFVGKVLSQYKTKRSTLDSRLSQTYEGIQKDKEFKDLENKRRKKIKDQYELFLNDESCDLDLSNCYMQLAQDGCFLHSDYASQFMTEAESKINFQSTNADLEFEAIGKRMFLKFEAEKLALVNMFKKIKEKGVKVIYDENYKLKVFAHEIEPQPAPEAELPF